MLAEKVVLSGLYLLWGATLYDSVRQQIVADYIAEYLVPPERFTSTAAERTANIMADLTNRGQITERIVVASVAQHHLLGNRVLAQTERDCRGRAIILVSNFTYLYAPDSILYPVLAHEVGHVASSYFWKPGSIPIDVEEIRAEAWAYHIVGKNNMIPMWRLCRADDTEQVLLDKFYANFREDEFVVLANKANRLAHTRGLIIARIAPGKMTTHAAYANTDHSLVWINAGDLVTYGHQLPALIDRLARSTEHGRTRATLK